MREDWSCMERKEEAIPSRGVRSKSREAGESLAEARRALTGGLSRRVRVKSGGWPEVGKIIKKKKRQNPGNMKRIMIFV